MVQEMVELSIFFAIEGNKPFYRVLH